MIVWWATEVECVSALARLEREGGLAREEMLVALERLDRLVDAWHEIDALASVRRTARRLLRAYSLRAADAFQLAAALEAADDNPAGLVVVALDDRLIDAVQREGFAVIEPSPS